MNHSNSSLSKLAAVASVLALAACGSTNQSSQANAPKSAQTTPEQYGAPMGQPGAGETGATGSTQSGPSATTGAGETSGSQATGTGASASETMDNPGGAPRSTMGSSGQSGGESGSAYGSGGSQYGTSGTTGSTGATNTMGGSTDVSSLSDAQFAGVLQAINQGRIQEALLGQNKGSTNDVKRFAREMVGSHRAVQNKESALFTRLELTPTDSALSNQLKTDTQNDISTLQSMHGRDFDRSFMDAQVRHLNSALELIDRIIPAVKSSDLKSELQTVRTKVDRHLQEAQRIQATLGQ